MELASIIKIEQRFGARLAACFRSKEAQSNAKKKLIQALERKRSDPGSSVVAKLTSHQMLNKQYIWEAIREPVQDGQLYWWMGYKLVLAVD